MDFFQALDRVIELLRQRERVSYRALKLELKLDDEVLDALREELVNVHQLAADRNGEFLVWIGEADRTPSLESPPPGREPPGVDAERRQLTLMFCDLADSTRLSGRLDPEDLREVLRAYQGACTGVIRRYDGYIAQHLGDGLLVYFGFPHAHEDDAHRAVRAGLDIVAAMAALNGDLDRERGVRLAVRIGIHTGSVVVGEVGEGGSAERLALGQAPNVAARIEGLAEPDTVVISAATHRLVQGYFACRDLGTHVLKGVERPLQLYGVLGESGARGRLEAAAPGGVTSLVGRAAEMGLLLDRWARAAEGHGHVVLLSGEAGIGKSRLVSALAARLAGDGHALIQFRCSAYHVNSAFYPVIDYLQRFLGFGEQDGPEARLAKLEAALRPSPAYTVETLLLFASLLSVPVGDRYPPLEMTPARQKRKTQEALVGWLAAAAARRPALVVWEDLHWMDPSTLEGLAMVVEQASAARLLVLLTCRPESPLSIPNHVTRIALDRLGEEGIREMIAEVTGGRSMPAEAVQHVIEKTDGVPLFIEELTRTIVEIGVLHDAGDRFELREPLSSLAIPSTLQDSLMARLDRLRSSKPVAQMGAVIGRTFSYGLLRLVAGLDDDTLKRDLARLVEAGLVHQQGTGEQAGFVFRHAMIQEAAYQSLLRRTRQQNHQRIAQALAEHFPQMTQTAPELLAHHYTEAGLAEQAVSLWQRAGEQAAARSALAEAISHLGKGLDLLPALPEGPERDRHELALQSALGSAMMATRGYAAPETERAYARARELAQKIGELPQLSAVRVGQWAFYLLRPQLGTALELAEEMLTQAELAGDRVQIVGGHVALGMTEIFLGEFVKAREHLEAGGGLYVPAEDRARAISRSGVDPRVSSLAYLARALWHLGYRDRALASAQAAVAEAEAGTSALSVAQALGMVASIRQLRGDLRETLEASDRTIAYAAERDLSYWAAHSSILRSWAQAKLGEREAGMAGLGPALERYRATGATLGLSWILALLAEIHAESGRFAEGLAAADEALAHAQRTGERYHEADVRRLKGELLLGQGGSGAEAAAETCFCEALDLARRQGARTWELRAALSRARLLRHRDEASAQETLASVCRNLTEGFEIAELSEARALLDDLAAGR